MNNIVLIGMMGVFKSTAGKLAAKRLDMDFIDTDTFIEEQNKMTVSEIFSLYGEKAFRKMEEKAVLFASQKTNCVIACGGGVSLNDKNMINLKNSGKIILLTAEPEIIFERIGNDKSRPLLSDSPSLDKIQKIFYERKGLYERYCEYIIDNTHLSALETANEIICQIKGNSI